MTIWVCVTIRGVFIASTGLGIELKRLKLTFQGRALNYVRGTQPFEGPLKLNLSCENVKNSSRNLISKNGPGECFEPIF